MQLSFGRASGLRASPAGPRQATAHRLRAAPPAAGAKGFGKQAPASGPLKDGCPCGSNKFYKDCCKPYHAGTIAPTLEATLRARFSACVKKEIDYLMTTYDPEFSSVYFNDTAPGENWDKLRGEMQRTIEFNEFSNFKILKSSDGASPTEKYAQLQYSLLDKRTPQLDASGKKVKRVVVETDRFLQDEAGRWRLADYRLSDMPTAVVKSAALETRDIIDKALDEAKKAAAA